MKKYKTIPRPKNLSKAHILFSIKTLLIIYNFPEFLVHFPTEIIRAR